MTSSSVICLDRAPPRSMAYRLRSWFDDLSTPDCDTVRHLLGHSIDFLLFEVLDGFVEGIISCWVPEWNTFRIGSQELTPTLKEWARISSLPLYGSCACVVIGDTRCQFITDMHLSRTALLVEESEWHSILLDFMLDKYGSFGGILCSQRSGSFIRGSMTWGSCGCFDLLYHLFSVYADLYGPHGCWCGYGCQSFMLGLYYTADGLGWDIHLPYLLLVLWGQKLSG